MLVALSCLGRIRSCMAVLTGFVLHASVIASAIDDGPGGATCRYFNAAARLEWTRPGSDWTDARGTEQGTAAFAEATLAPMRGTQTVSWNLLSLQTEWASGRVVPGAVLLRNAPGERAGPFSFASREHPDAALAPSLVVHWSDGQADRLKAATDTYFDCSTIRSLGSGPLLKVGPSQAALLLFPFEQRPGHSVTKLELVLSSTRQHGGTARIGAFGPQLPRASTLVGLGAGLSMALERDRGIHSHKDVLYSQRFEDSSWQEFASDPKTVNSLRTLSNDEPNRFEPIDGKALAVTIMRDTRLALNRHLRFANWPDGEPEEAFFRYHLRLAENWDPVVDGGKLPGFAGTYGKAGWGMRPSDGTNGWSARGAFMRHRQVGPPDTPWRAVGNYAYTASTEGRSGEVWGWNLGPTGRLKKNRWYSIEQYLKLNAPGRSDGVLRVWVDGQLAFEKTGLRWRDVSSLKIESVWLNVYHGGTSKADRDLTLYMDNLVIARQYIGPGNFQRK